MPDNQPEDNREEHQAARSELEDIPKELEDRMVVVLEELHKLVALEDTVEDLQVLRKEPAVQELSNGPVPGPRKDQLVGAEDDQLVVLRILAVVAAMELLVECYWHKDKELLVANAGNLLVVPLKIRNIFIYFYFYSSFKFSKLTSIIV